MSRPSAPEPVRTLADRLRGWPDDRLAGLLRDRPDLATPIPRDCAELAARAAGRRSLGRVLDRLTTAELLVLDAIVLLQRPTADEVVAAVRGHEDAVRAALARLVGLAVVWEVPGGLRALTGVRDQLAAGPPGTTSGLAAEIRLDAALDAHGRSPAALAARLAELRPQARALLDRLGELGGIGGIGAADDPPYGAGAGAGGTPLAELLNRRLVVARPGGAVRVPVEVGLLLRGGRTTRWPVDAEPELATAAAAPTAVQAAGAAAAFDAVRRLEVLLDHWGAAPPVALRAGGLGNRGLKAAAELLQVDPPAAALLVEVAWSARLIARGRDADGETAWLPTDSVDRWYGRPLEERWVGLARAWLDGSSTPGLVGTRDSKGRPWSALSPGPADPMAVEARRMALAALAELPADRVLRTPDGLPSLVALVAWRRPRRPAGWDRMVGWAVAEAARLGLLGAGGMSEAGRLLVSGDEAGAAAILRPLLPRPVRHVLLQADLTAVAPGPLETALSRRLHAVADVESRGGATVYRFSPASIRRALDSGWTASQLHEFLGSVSRTPVPQPLAYLVDDTARTFGSIRLGAAESFLRADDEAALTELLHHPGATSLGLRRLAPTVLVASAPVEVVLPRLRALGAAPVLEAADGTVQVARPAVFRTRAPAASPPTSASAEHLAARLPKVIGAIRAGDLATAARPEPITATTSPVAVLTTLRLAAEQATPVWITYADDHGGTTERVVDPESVEGGRLRGYDRRAQRQRDFAVHRVVAVRVVGSPTDSAASERTGRP